LLDKNLMQQKFKRTVEIKKRKIKRCNLDPLQTSPKDWSKDVVEIWSRLHPWIFRTAKKNPFGFFRNVRLNFCYWVFSAGKIDFSFSYKSLLLGWLFVLGFWIFRLFGLFLSKLRQIRLVFHSTTMYSTVNKNKSH
jgi:hypothetical protein